MSTKEMIQLTDHNNRPLMFYPNRLRLVEKNERSGKTVVTVAGFGECEVLEQPEQIRDLAGLIGLTNLDNRVFFVRPNITGIRGATYGTGALIHILGIGIKEVKESPQEVWDIQAAATA
jgi:hypothetical protein